MPSYIYWLVFFFQLFSLSSSSFTLLMLAVGLYLLRKMSHLIYILICLEILSMLALFMVLANFSFWESWQLSGGLLILVCLVLEASLGLGLLVSFIRWQNKTKSLVE